MRGLSLLILLLGAADAAMASPPRCSSLNDGAVACLDGKLCACRLDPGGSLTGRRAGTRWDCGALRPACGMVPPAAMDPAGPPQHLSPYLPMLPPAGWR